MKEEDQFVIPIFEQSIIHIVSESTYSTMAAEPFKKWYGGMTSLFQSKFKIQVELN